MESGFAPTNLECVPVQLSRIICDKPARSLIKQTKGHSGYYGCDKCVVHGVRLEGTMTFPQLDSRLRTDADFRSRSNARHHIGVSPFERLPIDMIESFPLDYMHLVCLGVTKNLLEFWVGGRARRPYRLSQTQRTEINRRISTAHSHTPSEFQRRCRPLEDSGLWKATEFRQFLLYLGPVVLSDMTESDIYKNFLDLSIAVYLFSYPL